MPPHVPSCEVPSSVFVGSGLELHCKDKLSVPPATYRWYKDNKALMATADTPYSIDTNKGALVSTRNTHTTCKYLCTTGHTHIKIYTGAYKRSHTCTDAQLLLSLIKLSPCLCLEQKFKSVSKTDAGMYRCESSNSVGAPKSCVAQRLKVIECKWFWYNSSLEFTRHAPLTKDLRKYSLAPPSRSFEYDDLDSRGCRFCDARPFLLHLCVCLPMPRLLQE